MSGFFRDTLRGREQGVVMQSVEISDSDDVEVYLETLVLMYSHDLKRRLMDEDVSRVLAFLKVSADIMFETGIESCLECLEAIPWSEDEEEKVVTQLSQLQLCDLAAEVLQRDHPLKIWSKEMKGTGDGEEKSLVWFSRGAGL
ncbi:hypothetical protein POTOM_054790 [Populus tomentosa]|uniref:BTB/POZ domain-containing protein n=1 Tax=Populus tomentosa TaxID=118781 RepID=A0A8X7Y3Z5_POPTO|nr:hypothetical protein POTOM_054790 [Populus tomentosa]